MSESNPNNFFEHRRAVMEMRDAVAALGAAYKITGNARYVTKAAECQRRFKEVFIAKLMALDGSFPAELRRTKPYGYPIFQDHPASAVAQVTARSASRSFGICDGRKTPARSKASPASLCRLMA